MKTDLERYAGQCFCYPSKEQGQCEHCNRARMYIDRDVYTLANELGEDMLKDETAWEEIENLEQVVCGECSEEKEDDGEPCTYCSNDDIDYQTKEVFQWFIVSGRMYHRLKDQGNGVAEYKDLYLWDALVSDNR